MLGLGVHPARENAPARKDERMWPIRVDHGEFKIEIEGSGSGLSAAAYPMFNRYGDDRIAFSLALILCPIIM